MTIHGAVFVCGCGHSGTTLIARILGASPGVHLPTRETSMFVAEEHRERRIAAVEREFEASGKARLVEKTPRHIRHLDEIRERFPGARFVVPVRDGRDVVASIARRTQNPESGARRWIRDNTVVARVRTAPDVVVYRHEDLVRAPSAIVRRICDVVDLPFSEDLLRYHEQPPQWLGIDRPEPTTGEGKDHGMNRAWQVSQPIFDSSGRWRTELSAEDLQPLMEGRGARLMRLFGYGDGPG